MQIKAFDADEPGTINSKISYSILKQTPVETGSMFSIDKDTGKVYVKERTLDREVTLLNINYITNHSMEN